ncbi:BKACE family enzyme [Paraburkholderia elongata]|jgi:3-keto-5-aminohexanoate cleavage enzyme|uniref:3-keto-5-aminohexanoate cleavage protein n=1 Tax=Paraburkholderia elongata TaxID=2675747 RepID=A0A972NV95_9BURK|nr:3-keto-5-aminohexanoate cleavage protein [Paraburkholderia elongata]NPT60351.1 3-keto-5-aminohexanoate cleavage protein [Paraburkholderia elongata]
MYSTSHPPVIIEVCLNGVTSREVQPHVPRTPQEVTADALSCVAAGATILHSHTDDPVIAPGSGRHDSRPLIDAWAPVIDRYPDIIFYPTMQGGGGETTIEARTQHMQELVDAGLLRLGLIDMGTSNMSFLGEDGLPGSSDELFINTNSDAHYMFEFCIRNRIGASIGCIEPGFLRTAMAFARAGKIPQGSIFRLVFGGPRTLMGLPGARASLDLYLEMIQDAGIPWNVGIFGGNAFENGFAEYAMERGGHLRIGLEDYRAADTPTNVELVERAVALAKKVGRPVATRRETNQILNLQRQPEIA